MNNAHLFIRQFAKFLSQYGLTYKDIKSGKIIIDNTEIDLDSLSLDKEYFSVELKETIFEPLSHQLLDSPSVSKVIELGTHPKNTCKSCGSSLKTKWFGLKNTEKCINPNCSEYFDRGFDIILKSMPNNYDATPAPTESILAPSEMSRAMPNNHYPDTLI